MYPVFDWYRFLQGLQETLIQQKEQLTRLEHSIQKLSEAVNALQEKTFTHVEKIDYHFDQLKVEKLEGTLNIGITPHSSGSIEDYVTGQSHSQDVNWDTAEGSLFSKIKRRVDEFLDQTVAEHIRSLENQYKKPIDEEYRRLMLEDLRRQADGRIREYLNRVSADQPEADDEIENNVVERLKRDIFAALNDYFANMPPREEENQ